MANCKISDEELVKAAHVYNIRGQRATCALLRSQYNVKAPYSVIKRMRRHALLGYDPAGDHFSPLERAEPNDVFMSMEELCPPNAPSHLQGQDIEAAGNRPDAMEKLIQKLIGDRLLEMSKYVTIDCLSRIVTIDRTGLINDGYRPVIH